jgi:flavin-dependent dehydrogenase
MKPITIVGGGLAGLTLGILLRRENIPVAVIEAGNYPRHRVCGEFVSGRGREILYGLEVEDKFANKFEARTCSFHLRDCDPVKLDLKWPALCVSRYDLDAALAEEFQWLGGILKTGERATLEDREGHIRATGRRRSTNPNARLFGLKAHAAGAALSSDLELHFGKSRYVGLCRLASGEINACGLFKVEEPNTEIHRLWKNIFAQSVWSESLRDIRWDEQSFCSVAGLTLDREAPVDVFCVGDSAAMIPPLTGNGMSMAFESAQLAAGFAQDYSSGKFCWGESLKLYQAAWRTAFAGRLRWAAVVQKLIFHPAGQQILHCATRLFPSLPGIFFSKTR